MHQNLHANSERAECPCFQVSPVKLKSNEWLGQRLAVCSWVVLSKCLAVRGGRAIVLTGAREGREVLCCTAGVTPSSYVMIPPGEPNPEPVGWAEVSSVFGLAGLAEPSHALSGRAYQSPGHRDH